MMIRDRYRSTSYQIDQSGKIEQTNKDTVIAYSNDKQYAVLISKKIKRQVQEGFRLCGYTRSFIYYLFSIGVFYLLKDIRVTSDVIIDKEYPGKEKIIIHLISSFLQAYRRPSHTIHFARIGNTPKVHYAAHDVFTKKKKPDYKITLSDIIEVIKKTDGRLRECLSTLVDARPRSIIEIYTKRRKKSRKQNKKA